MKTWIRYPVLALGLVFAGDAAMGDFYVIPVKKGSSGALLARTGQDTCYKSASPWGTCTCGTADCPAGQDGDLREGAAWPNPRFTDNGNGTVKDNLTGLVWTKDSTCGGTKTWGDALTYCNGLAAGQCGLTDGSVAGDWRMPNARELESLVDRCYWDPAMPNTAGTGQALDGDPFTNLISAGYWSSSSYANGTGIAWGVYFYYGHVTSYSKTDTYYVRCVR